MPDLFDNNYLFKQIIKTFVLGGGLLAIRYFILQRSHYKGQYLKYAKYIFLYEKSLEGRPCILSIIRPNVVSPYTMYSLGVGFYLGIESLIDQVSKKILKNY